MSDSQLSYSATIRYTITLVAISLELMTDSRIYFDGEPVAKMNWMDEVVAAHAAQAELEELRAATRSRLRFAVLHAYTGGNGATAIARQLGVTRDYIYQVIAAAKREFPEEKSPTPES